MRKLLILAAAILLTVAITAPSFAADTTFEGQYRIRAWTNWNFDKRPNHFDSENGLYTGYFDQRFRLTITHKRSEFLKAVIQIDLVEDTWGQQRNFRINDSYIKLVGKEYVMTTGFVRKAYIEFKVPSIGTFTVGKMPQTFGHGLVFSDSLGKLDGLKWTNTWGPVAVSAMYFKWRDNVSTTTPEVYNRDTDIWAVGLKYVPNKNHAIELFGGYVNYRTGYPAGHNLTRYTKGGGYDPNLVNSNVGFAGIAYTGEIAGMLTLKAEFSGVFGTVDRGNLVDSETKFTGGYNIYLDASYHNELLRAGAAFVLGSGDTESRFRDSKFNANFITADKFIFGNIIASGNGGLQDKWWTGLGYSWDIENLTAIKLYFEIYPTEKLSLAAAVIWAKWTEPVGNAKYGYAHPANYYSGHGINAYDSWYASTDLGWEIDLNASYKIMDGLTYSMSAGVLFTGNSFDYVSPADGSHEDWGPIWMINNTLTYEF